ncbi:hypothetical protein DRQ50_01750 [bacterium]|nr:MAG: hypothetical protein DRQ50_01750 [bacterium]
MTNPDPMRISGDELRRLFENGPLGYQSLDSEGRIGHVNDAWLELLGYSADEVIGRWIGDFIAPEDLAQLAERFPRFLATGEVRRLAFSLRRKDGTPIRVEVDGRVEDKPDGTPLRTHCLLHDVSALHTSREQLQHLFENAPVGLWAEDFSAVKAALDELRNRGVTDLDAHLRGDPGELQRLASLVRVVDVNQAVLDLHGATSREQLLSSISDTFTAKSFEGFHREVVALFNGARECTVESELRTFDGEVRPVLARILLDPQFTDWSVAYVAITDLTDAKANALLNTAMEQAAEIIMVTDCEGVIQYINPAFTRITGYERGEALGRNVNFLRSDLMDDDYFRRMWATLTAGRVWSGPMTNRRKDGSLYEEEATISPVRDRTGQVIAYVAVKRDVTRERDLEQRLVQSQKLEAVGQLAGGIAHDFNNILQAMTTSLEFAADETQPPETRLQDLGILHRAVERATVLTQRLLTFSRGQTLKLDEVAVDQLLEHMLEMMRRLIAANIVLDYRPGADKEILRADFGQLEQVLVNLCVNARDAMPDGGTITVETDVVTVSEEEIGSHPWAEAGDYVTITVSDTGCGMDAGVLKQIYEPFFSTKDTGRGTGLGLSVVYGAVKKHGGFLRTDSTPGEGSSFVVHLPRGKPGGVTRKETRPSREVRGGYETILVAEDDPMVLTSVHRILERGGYEVVTATDGIEACALVQATPDRFALVLLDIMMPNLGGREAAQRIATLAPDTAILFSSGYSSGVFDDETDHPEVLRKPYDGNQLLSRVRTAIGGA